MKLTKKRMRRMDHDRDEQKDFEDLVLYQAMKPLFVCMMVSGVFYIKLQGQALFSVSCAKTQTYTVQHMSSVMCIWVCQTL